MQRFLPLANLDWWNEFSQPNSELVDQGKGWNCFQNISAMILMKAIKILFTGPIDFLETRIFPRKPGSIFWKPE